MSRSMLLSRICLALALLGFACCIAGCNTMEGAGKDVEKAGESIQDAAD
jgi:entericidin B